MSALDNVLAGMHTRLKGSIVGAIFATPGTRREEREGPGLRTEVAPSRRADGGDEPAGDGAPYGVHR